MPRKGTHHPKYNDCPDCGQLKMATSARCYQCALREIRARKVVHPCMDCGKPTSGAKRKRCLACSNKARGVGSLDRPFPMGGNEAAEYGAIVTLENDAGERLTLHRTDAVRRAVRQACEHAEKLDPSYKVICVSTPSGIYRDLQGDRANSQSKFGDKARLPETMLRLGDRIHPRLLSAGEHQR